MNAFTDEIKTRARLLQKLLQTGNVAALKRARIICRQQRWDIPEQWQLRYCLNLAAADAGFSGWEHARQVLSGAAQPGDDMGEFWYGAEARGFTNQWLASYEEARALTEANPYLYLLPYRRQYLLVEELFLQDRGLSCDPALWEPMQRDLVRHYGSDGWQQLARQRLRSTRLERFEKTWDVQRATLDLQASEEETARILRSFIRDGRLQKIPEQKKKRLVVLRWMLDQLDSESRYPEQVLNGFFQQFHEDYATLRREMITNGLMQRDNAVYWKA